MLVPLLNPKFATVLAEKSCELRVRGTSGAAISRGAKGTKGSMPVWLTFLALLSELIVGYPDWLVRAIGHPVTWIGRLIGALDKAWNRDGEDERRRRLMGVL